MRADAVEQVGGRDVVQYREAIVPLARLDRLLGGRVDSAGGDLEQQELLVIMFTRGARTVAVAVTTVLDIADDDPAKHTRIDDGGVVGLTILEGRVTELLDVRQAVLSADPSFFDDDVADATSAWNIAHTALGPVVV